MTKNTNNSIGSEKYLHTVHFFFTFAIGNCMVKLNFCSDENIQSIFGTKLEDFLNYEYRIDYNSIS
jgi:hypothetical protein